jgi:hypothetical protein
MCVERLKKFSTLIEEDKSLLERGGFSRNTKNCILYRRSEKRVLLQTLEFVKSDLRKLRWDERETDFLRPTKDDGTFETVDV